MSWRQNFLYWQSEGVAHLCGEHAGKPRTVGVAGHPVGKDTDSLMHPQPCKRRRVAYARCGGAVEAGGKAREVSQRVRVQRAARRGRKLRKRSVHTHTCYRKLRPKVLNELSAEVRECTAYEHSKDARRALLVNGSYGECVEVACVTRAGRRAIATQGAESAQIGEALHRPVAPLSPIMPATTVERLPEQLEWRLGT